MGDRENQRAREIGEGRLGTQYLNGRHGTDYESRAGEREAVDVVLVSPSGQYPPREGQAVTIPLDYVLVIIPVSEVQAN